MQTGPLAFKMSELCCWLGHFMFYLAKLTDYTEGIIQGNLLVLSYLYF